MDALEAARAWAEEWARAWRTHDADLVGTLYAEGSSFRSQAFRRPEAPAGYARWAFEEEAKVECWFSEPRLAAGDGAVVEYWAISTGRDGTVETIAGVALLRFAADGRVVDERDYWNTVEGRVDPYDGWEPPRS
jgi:ketosteroid isomerase-like protein